MFLQSLYCLGVTVHAAVSLLLPNPAYLYCTDLVSQVTGRAHSMASLTQEVPA